MLKHPTGIISITALIVTTMLIACNNSSDHSSPSASAAAVPPGHYAPPSAYRGASDVTANDLDPYVALNEFGTWEEIGKDRYFKPSTATLRGYKQWQPYENGYWSFDENLGWSFASQDRWGWLTEHFGIWRHHEKHGWVWLPFRDRHYEASCVTWFDEGNYVGWYPYSKKFATYYYNGNGFDDQYWYGYKSIANGNIFNIGITLVLRTDVTQPNIYRHIIRDPSIVLSVALRGHSEARISQGLVGPHPGGELKQSYAYIQNNSPANKAPVGRAQSITAKGGAHIMQPPIPAQGHPSLAGKVKEPKAASPTAQPAPVGRKEVQTAPAPVQSHPAPAEHPQKVEAAPPLPAPRPLFKRVQSPTRATTPDAEKKVTQPPVLQKTSADQSNPKSSALPGPESKSRY